MYLYLALKINIRKKLKRLCFMQKMHFLMLTKCFCVAYANIPQREKKWHSFNC